MWHKAIWKGHPMRLELTRVGLLVELANHCTTRGAQEILSTVQKSNSRTVFCQPISLAITSLKVIVFRISSGALFVSAFHQDRTWHKVNGPKVDYSGGFGEGKVKHKPRLEPCWTMLVIGPLSAIWAWWA